MVFLWYYFFFKGSPIPAALNFYVVRNAFKFLILLSAEPPHTWFWHFHICIPRNVAAVSPLSLSIPLLPSVSTEDWTQGLKCARHYLVELSPLLSFHFYFETTSPLAAAPKVAGTTDLSQQIRLSKMILSGCQYELWGRESPKILPFEEKQSCPYVHEFLTSTHKDPSGPLSFSLNGCYYFFYFEKCFIQAHKE